MDLVIDPVCGMQFAPEHAPAGSEWLDRTFYFRHPVCKKIFDSKPSRFVYGEKPKQDPRRTKWMRRTVTSATL